MPISSNEGADADTGAAANTSPLGVNTRNIMTLRNRQWMIYRTVENFSLVKKQTLLAGPLTGVALPLMLYQELPDVQTNQTCHADNVS